MDNYDKILKGLFRNTSISKTESVNRYGAGEKDCLSEEVFAAYLENLLDGTDKEKIEEHLSDCKACRENSIILNKIRMEVEKEALLKAPNEVTVKAKRLVHNAPSKDLVDDKCQDIVYTKMCHDIVYSLYGIRMLSLIPYVSSA